MMVILYITNAMTRRNEKSRADQEMWNSQDDVVRMTSLLLQVAIERDCITLLRAATL
jgi:hypothetical protein